MFPRKEDICVECGKIKYLPQPERNLPTPFERDLMKLINENSQENVSNTPDFILARYLVDCLDAFDRAVNRREGHYGRREIET